MNKENVYNSNNKIEHNYLKREDFINSVDSDKIWSKSMTMPEVIELLNTLEEEINKHDYTSDKNFLMDGRRCGLMSGIKGILLSNDEDMSDEVLEALFGFWEFVNNEYCVITFELTEKMHLNRIELDNMCNEYTKKGIISLEEKDNILEMIEEIRKAIKIETPVINKKEILDKIEKIVYVTQPSPIVMVSTTSKDNIDNVAPFGMFMNCSTKPDNMVAIAVSPTTDTYRNIIDTREFIVGIPKESMLNDLCKCGVKYDSDVSEFDVTNLTPYGSNNVKCKRIKECIVNIDCIFVNEMETGNHHIIVGKVVGCDIDEDMYSDDKVVLRNNIPRIYHMTGNTFMVNDELKKIEGE